MHRGLKYGLYAVVLTGLVGGTVAWVSVDKTVKVAVDGQMKTVHTTSGTVKGVLSDADIKVADHDLVAPGLSAKVHDGSEIVLKRGRLLHLSVDGQERDVWVTTPTVADALGQLGYSTADFSSVSRSTRLPLSPTDIDLRTDKNVTVVADGKTHTLQSTDANVGALLTDLQITLGADDRVSIPTSSAFADGSKIIVQRVKKGQQVVSRSLPFTVTTKNDSSLTKGTTVVVAPGKPGVQSITYATIYIDGKLAGKTQIGVKTVAAPQARVVNQGTKPIPVVTPPPSTPSSSNSSSSSSSGGSAPANTAPAISVTPGSAQAIAQQLLLARGWGADQFSCLVQMWNRESGWRVDAANGSGAYGIPQALPGSKMAQFGSDWQTNPRTQIEWGLSYISSRYGTPCGAWGTWQSQGWY